MPRRSATCLDGSFSVSVRADPLERPLTRVGPLDREEALQLRVVEQLHQPIGIRFAQAPERQSFRLDPHAPNERRKPAPARNTGAGFLGSGSYAVSCWCR